jgi:hypothetical protein
VGRADSGAGQLNNKPAACANRWLNIAVWAWLTLVIGAPLVASRIMFRAAETAFLSMVAKVLTPKAGAQQT